MEPKFQTSFIPKTPITSSSSSFSGTPKMSFNILSTFTVLFFIVSILASAGVFGYTYYLKSQIDSLNNELALAKKAFESEDNQKIILISDQLKSIRTLLSSHKVVSPLFQVMESETLPTVRFKSFIFSRDGLGQVTATISGEAQSYASLAQQSKIFTESKAFKEISFTSVTLSSLGTVEMTMKVIINPDITSYSSKLQSLSTIFNIAS